MAVSLVAAACGSESTVASTEPEPTVAAEPTVEAAVPKATTAPATETPNTAGTLTAVANAQWADNVTIETGADTFQFISDGLPSHELPDEFLIPVEGNMPPFDGDNVTEEFEIVATDELLVASPLNVEITLNPVYADEVTLTSLSTIGVMISGVPLFNDYEDMNREFVALDDNLSLDGAFFVDACNGHPLASGNSYHYHGVPYCITDDVDVAGQHSTLIGVLLDGFPIYGPQDTDGVTISSADLDECSGHVGATPEFPEGIYHYHLTEDMNPYSIDCFHGEIDYGGNDRGAPPGGGQGGGEGAAGRPGGGGPPDLTEAAATLGVSAADLETALGQPPFDLAAAAATLGVTEAALESAVPAPGEGRPGGGQGAPPGGGQGQPPANDTAAESATPADTGSTEFADRSAAILNAAWGDNVTISIDGGTATFSSDGLPNHEFLDVYLGDGRDGKFIAGGVEPYNANFSFPVVPTMASVPSETPNGAIGVAVSGSVFFDPFEGDGSGTVANDDNATIDGIPFIDACGGHPLPNAVSYHYHGIPFCITDALDTDGQHSELIGYLFDGFGIYGPQDVDGAEPTDLDQCMGHIGPTPNFDEDTYHYHVSSTANYISACFSGVR